MGVAPWRNVYDPCGRGVIEEVLAKVSERMMRVQAALAPFHDEASDGCPTLVEGLSIDWCAVSTPERE